MTLEEKRIAWMRAVREHSHAVKLSSDSGKPIPNLLHLLAKLKTARTAYFDDHLESERRQNEAWRRRIIIVSKPYQPDEEDAE